MSEPVFVKTFRRGEAVPEWLFTIEPIAADSERGTIVFEMDCHCFETPRGYVLIPRIVELIQKHGFIQVDSAKNVVIRATEKAVYMAMGWSCHYGGDDVVTVGSPPWEKP